MGIVDYAASTCLALSGTALAAPYLESKFPALGGTLTNFTSYRKYLGFFGIIGGGLGLVVIPLVILFVVGIGGLFESLPALFITGLELIGCAATIALGVMIVRKGTSAEPATEQLDLDAMLGLGGMVYGGFLMLLFGVVSALA